MNAQSSNPGLDEYSQPPAIDTGGPNEEAADDWDDDKKGRQLTLMEELLLIGLKDSQVRSQGEFPPKFEDKTLTKSTQGTLSFWNDNISYVLRGCIIMELSFRSRIQVKREPRRRPFQDRLLEVIDDSNTGEVLLDEALRYMKGDEDTIANWIDFLSGTTTHCILHFDFV